MTRKKLGRYDLLRVLGKGAMGLVYEGRDPNLDRRVAIKTIKVENLSEQAAAEYEARFRTEARSAARLQHPNIVSVYDSDRDGDIAFLVMEYIEGEDLKHHLDQGKRHTLEQTVAIMADLLSALDYAHRAKIVHRDIKPANLLIEASGRVKLTDFGVARIQDSGDVTRTQGSMVGTLKYMSPEQVQGQPVDARSDLFAAGVVLYQVVTGKRPFDADSDFAIIQRIVAQDPVPPSSINPQLPAGMDAVLARALAKQREKRYTSAKEFADALQACAEQAQDRTAVAPRAQTGPGNSTWTGTVRAGESLVDTQAGTVGGMTAVAQELELVYWKDVKDSADTEDLLGFLARFPTGIYASLARRRLRKLGFTPGEDWSLGSLTGTNMPLAPLASAPLQVPGSGSMPPRMEQSLADAGKPVESVPPLAREVVTTSAQATGDLDATHMAPPVQQFAPAEPAPPPPAANAGEVEPTLLVERPAAPLPTDEAMADAMPDLPNDRVHDAIAEPAPASASRAASGTEAATAIASETPDTPETTGLNTEDRVAQPEPAPGDRPASFPQVPPDFSAPAIKTNRKPMAWAIGAMAVLVVAVIGFSTMSGPSSPDAAPLAGASTPSDAGAAPTESASTPLPAAVAVQTEASASQALAASAPARAGTAPVAVDKKATPDKARLAASVPSLPSRSAATAAAAAPETSPAPPPAPAPRPAVQAQAPPPRAAPAPAPAAQVSSGPEQACEDRKLIAFQICMAEQCEKPAFVRHAVCVERRAMDQRRRDAAQSGR